MKIVTNLSVGHGIYLVWSHPGIVAWLQFVSDTGGGHTMKTTLHKEVVWDPHKLGEIER